MAEGHKEADALDALDVDAEAFQLLVVQQVHVLFAHACKVIFALNFHGFGFYPMAVLPVAAVSSYFADVDFRVEVGGKRIAVVAAVAVQNIDVVNLVKIVLLCIGRENAGYARVKAAAQNSADAGLFEFLAVSPLPFILKLCRVQRLIVGSINIVRFGGKAGVHDNQILIGKCQVQNDIGIVFVDDGNQLVHVVGIHLLGVNFCFGGAFQLSLQVVAFRFGAAGNDDFLKNVAVLAAFVDGNAGDAAAADD